MNIVLHILKMKSKEHKNSQISWLVLESIDTKGQISCPSMTTVPLLYFTWEDKSIIK